MASISMYSTRRPTFLRYGGSVAAGSFSSAVNNIINGMSRATGIGFRVVSNSMNVSALNAMTTLSSNSALITGLDMSKAVNIASTYNGVSQEMVVVPSNNSISILSTNSPFGIIVKTNGTPLPPSLPNAWERCVNRNLDKACAGDCGHAAWFACRSGVFYPLLAAGFGIGCALDTNADCGDAIVVVGNPVPATPWFPAGTSMTNQTVELRR